MKVCPYCGSNNEDDTKVCARCFAELMDDDDKRNENGSEETNTRKKKRSE